MKPILLTLSLLCTAFSVAAQDLHIYYDMETQTPRYLLGDTLEIDQPYVRQGNNVILHIQNYNNYLYDVVIERETEQFNIPSSTSAGSLTSIFPTLGPNATDFMSLGAGSRDAPVGFDFVPKLNGNGERGDVAPYEALGLAPSQYERLTQLMQDYEKTFQEVQEMDLQMKQKEVEVQSLVDAYQVNAFAMQEIRNIRHDPALPPAKIKEMTQDYMRKVLNVQTNDQINLDTLLRKGNIRQQLTRKLNEVRRTQQKHQQAVAKLDGIRETVTMSFGSNPGVRTRFVQPLLESYSQIESQEDEYTTFEDKLINLITQVPEADVQKLATLWREYEALQANDFAKDHRVDALGDQMTFNIRFSPNDSANSNVPTLQMAPIKVAVAGGFKVNASIGVAFGQFFDRPQSYFIRDQRIRAEDNDSFYPVISSFFHFYSQSKGNTSFGGAFGIGLPVTGSNAGQSASFFLGPSLIIGRSERLVLSGGLMGSQVERLAQGYNVGDLLVSDANVVPTKDVYEMGYFLGLSFNVIGSNR
jgi:hypothetical protein